jgi:hypothetical protein
MVQGDGNANSYGCCEIKDVQVWMLKFMSLRCNENMIPTKIHTVTL